jgi:hypothetical protein
MSQHPILPDYYTNPEYWQVYECSGCKGTFTVSPIPRLGTRVECFCGSRYDAGENDPTTYVQVPGNSALAVPYPQPE